MNLEKPTEMSYIPDDTAVVASPEKVFQGTILEKDEEKGNKALKALESLKAAFDKKMKN